MVPDVGSRPTKANDLAEAFMTPPVLVSLTVHWNPRPSIYPIQDGDEEIFIKS